MSYAPASLLALRKYLILQTRLPAISLGIVGNTAHRLGYHLGKDRIYSKNDYSVKTVRDINGLSNAASAMDIGNFPGLRPFSSWLVSELRKGVVTGKDIREVIYSPDGVKVLRWDRQRGVSSAPREGEADNSHRTHTHFSQYRDAEKNQNTLLLFQSYFDPPTVPMFHAAKGIYKTYKVVKGRAVLYGTLKTNGFKASYKKIVATQVDGTGKTTLLLITSSGYKGRIIYRYAPGIILL